jgi:uncharacterized repeat protein (TIGR03803 family)
MQSCKVVIKKACACVAICQLASTGLQAQTFTSLYSFVGTSDGAGPHSPLIVSSNTLYGTTTLGGVGANGTAFKLSTDGTGFKTLYAFPGAEYGGQVWGSLVLSQNVLYGSSQLLSGTVFDVTTDGLSEKILYSFSGLSDGGIPMGGLISDGNTLYGTTESPATVFKIHMDGTGFTTLQCLSCDPGTDQVLIYGGLALGGDSLYGMTFNGGKYSFGSIFKVSTNGTGFATLHDFANDGVDGGFPWSDLLLSGNKLYGTTMSGKNMGGVLFTMNTDGTGYKVLHFFSGNTNGWEPHGGLALANNTLYGTTAQAGTGPDIQHGGIVYSVNTDGIGFKMLYSFSGGADGGNPYVGVTISGNILYGATTIGGVYNHGTIFRLSLPFTPTPATIVRSASNLIVAWPTSSGALTLQSSTNLIAWDPVAQAPQVVNGQFAVTNTMSGDRRFFRLAK